MTKLNLSEDGMAVSTEILLRAREKNLLIKEVSISIRYDVKESSTHNPVSEAAGILYSFPLPPNLHKRHRIVGIADVC